MELFEKDSAFDLAMRGFTQDYILDKTGFDVGYHNAKIKTQMRGIDRMEYRVTFIRANYNSDFIIGVIDEYANGLGKDDVLAKLGVYGDRMVQLKVLFEMLGFLDEFKIADKSFRKSNMKNGTVEKYGVDNVFKLAEIQEAAKQTRIDKYGAAYTLCEESSLCETARTTQIEHMKNEEFKESVIDKRKTTTMERYGVEHPMQSDGVKAKVKATSLERYGAESYIQSEAGRAQASKYMKEHGKEIALKSRETMRERYGVDNHAQTKERRKTQSERMKKCGKEIYPKMQKTMEERYGVPYYSQTEAFRKAMSERMKKHAKEYRQKAIQTCLQKYGVDFYVKTDEARQAQSERMLNKEYNNRIIQSKKENGTLNTSNGELVLYEMLIEHFDENDVIFQYNSDYRYPFSCDFYIKSRDMFIELNGLWTHGGHWYDKQNTCDVEKLKKWNSSKKKYYKTAELNWTSYDVNKRIMAMNGNLNYVVFWDDNLDDAILWFAMGCPNGQDWKQEYSWLPKRQIDALQIDAPIIQSNKSIIKAAKFANGNEFYKHELKLWSENPYLNRSGNVHSKLYSNRYKYLGKLPDELSDIEIIRGLSISGLCKSHYTAFDTNCMLGVFQKYNVSSVYDPCAGWGERLLACSVNNIAYVGCDINLELHDGYDRLIQHYGLHNVITIHYDSAKYNATDGAHDTVFTCPPYGNREIYTEVGAENLSNDEFLLWWNDVIKHSISPTTKYFMYQIDKKHCDDMNRILQENGLIFVEEIIASDSTRHENKAKGKLVRENYEAIQVFAIPQK